MKIIAETGEGFMLTATTYELRKLSDCYYEKDRQIETKVGQEIPISDMYDQVKFLMAHKNTIDLAKAKLQKIIDNLENIKPFVEP